MLASSDGSTNREIDNLAGRITWSVDDVAGWLCKSVELPQYCDLFRDHGVDGDALSRLDAAGLRELGVINAVEIMMAAPWTHVVALVAA